MYSIYTDTPLDDLDGHVTKEPPQYHKDKDT